MTPSRSRAFPAALAVLLLTARWPLAHAQSAEAVFRAASRSVALIRIEDGGQQRAAGSGVAIPSAVTGLGDSPAEPVIVTNCHVIDVRGDVIVESQGRRTPAVLLGRHQERDLCLLSAPGSTLLAAKIGNPSALNPGAPVFAIGNPRGLEGTITDGVFSGFRSTTKGTSLLQTTAPISPGSSGGGLFDREGKLVGITTFMLRESQNLNFAVSVAHLKEIALAISQATAPAAVPAQSALEPLEFKGIRLGQTRAEIAALKGVTCSSNYLCSVVVNPLLVPIDFFAASKCEERCDPRFETIAGESVVRIDFQFWSERLDSITLILLDFLKTKPVYEALEEKYGKPARSREIAGDPRVPHLGTRIIFEWDVGESRVEIDYLADVRYVMRGSDGSNVYKPLVAVRYISARQGNAERDTRDKKRKDL